MTSLALNNIFAYLIVNTGFVIKKWVPFLQHITGIMHGEEFITDNMIKVGYAVISVDWRSVDCSRIIFSSPEPKAQGEVL